MADTQTLHGLDGVLDNLKKLGAEASKRGGPARAALAKAAKVIRDEAIKRAPEKTGNLRDNIIMKRDPKPQMVGAAEVYWVGVKGGGRRKYADTKRNRRNRRTGQEYEVSGNAWYWKFHEFGTEKMRARPFLRPAFEATKQEALETIITELKRGIERIQLKNAKGKL